MDKNTLYKYISEIFKEPNIDDDTVFLELANFSSISLMELVGVFEENDIVVDFAALLDCETVLDIYNLINQ